MSACPAFRVMMKTSLSRLVEHPELLQDTNSTSSQDTAPALTTFHHRDSSRISGSGPSCSPLPPLCHTECVSKQIEQASILLPDLLRRKKMEWKPSAVSNRDLVARNRAKRQTYPSGGFTSTGAFLTSSQLVDRVVPPDSTKLFIIARLESSSAPA